MLKRLNFKVILHVFGFLFILTLSGVLPDVGVCDQTLKIAAWNIQRLGEENEEGESKRTKKEFTAIAKILKSHDLIAITELMPDEVVTLPDKNRKLKDDADLKQILEILSDPYGRNYNYWISPLVGAENYYEHYIILFDEEKGIDVEERGVCPELRKEDRIDRDPYWVDVSTGKGNFDFSLILVHIYYGSKRDNWKKFSKRREEVKVLGEVYDYVQKENEGEQDVLLVGDFNLNPCDVEAFRNLMSLGAMKALFHQSKHRSTIGEEGRLYDNIFFDTDHLTDLEYIKNSESDNASLMTDYSDYANISDHLPMSAEFKIGSDDDDKERGPNGGYLIYYMPFGKAYHASGCRYIMKDKVLKEHVISVPLKEVSADCYNPCRVCDPPILKKANSSE